MSTSRYEDSEIIDEDGTRFFESTLPPDVERDESDIIITTESGQRLDRIAFRQYGDAKLWWVIAAANNLGRGDLTVPANTRLQIPRNESRIFDELREINDR